MPHLFNFYHKLKDEGVKVTLHQEIDTCRSLQYIDIFNFEDFYHLLKTNLISSPKDIRIFDNVFFLHWQFLKEHSEEEMTHLAARNDGEAFVDENASSMEVKKAPEVAPTAQLVDDLKEDTKAEEVPVYSPDEKLQEKDFSTFSKKELEAIKEIIPLIARKIRFRESRRKKAEDKGRFFDFRRTLRKNIRYGGSILSLSWKSRKITKTRIILLCDVSGSMERYSRFLIQFIYSLQNALDSMQTFVFSTRLSRITAILRSRGFEKALGRISRSVHDWSGGTQIGACLKAFNRRYASTFLYGKTILIIISDGWDCGDEHLLRQEMARLRKKAYHVIWLNPLLANPPYRPTCMGMRTALPFVDQFFPLHNLDSLIKLGQALAKID